MNVSMTNIQAIKIEEQIIKERKTIDYYSADYSVELIYTKFSKGREADENEIFVPMYQREFRWNKKEQSRFIESILLWLPVPPLFLCDSAVEQWSFFSRLEIVDGSQRVRTISAFFENKLKIEWLKRLTHLNGCYYKDLAENIKNLFKRLPIRVFVLSEKTTEEARMDLFERINTSSVSLTPAEVRKWAIWWRLYLLYKDLSESNLFQKLCPLSKKRIDKEEGTELVLRFFAYSENFDLYNQNVQTFLDEYMAEKRDKIFWTIKNPRNEKTINWDLTLLKNKFFNMLEFVDRYFPNWFMKEGKKQFTSRTFFEAVAVGSQLALDEATIDQLYTANISWWINSKDFNDCVKSDGANNVSNFKKRILFVKDMLLWTTINH